MSQQSLSEKIESIVSQMTLEQKCALLSGGTAFKTRAMPRHGIPALQFSDGPHGLRLQGEGANHLGIGGSLPATCFPTAATVANSWDPGMGEALGFALGEECLAEKVDVVLGPGLCIKRSPLCGRDFEYFSEDPYLAGKMAAGYVRGIQSTGVAACPKHFAVNSQETRRQASDSVLDERTLREIYLTAFEIVVRESDPKCIMSSYNRVNGTYANESPQLLTDILRRDWGFDGAVVTDWGGSNDHVDGVRAGSNFEMPDPGLSPVRELMTAVQSGRLAEGDVDTRVREALQVILPTTAATQAAGSSFDVEAHHAVAREVAANSIVLLKNEATDQVGPILPLSVGAKVALIGDFANEPRYQGAGSSMVNPTKLESLLDCVMAAGLDCVGFEPGFERHGAPSPSKAAAAVDLARRADVVLLCMGLDEQAESEGMDRPGMSVNQNQIELLHQLGAVNPNIVVLLVGGAPMECGWASEARALVYLCLGGQAGASAALDVVMGKVNPSGKLSESWARSLADTPTAETFPAQGHMAVYREGPYVGYRYYQTAGVSVAFPFGYGLSYTSFEYSGLKAGADVVTLSVTNTGQRAGAEVVQLYVSKPEREVFRPEQELKGFAKVFLEPGETKDVTIALDDKAFRYFNVRTGSWEVEGGAYELRVGASCEDIRLRGRVELAGTDAENPYEGLELRSYESGRIKEVTDAEFEALLGRPVPQERATIDRNMCICDLIHGRSPLFWLLWAVLNGMRKSGERRGTPNLNVLFIWNMPLRALAKNAGGVFSMEAVDGLVMEAKGFWVIGLVRVLVGIAANLARNAWQAGKLSKEVA